MSEEDSKRMYAKLLKKGRVLSFGKILEIYTFQLGRSDSDARIIELLCESLMKMKLQKEGFLP